MPADPIDLVPLVTAALVRGERFVLATTDGDPATLTYVPSGSFRMEPACYLLRIGPAGAHKHLTVFATAGEAAAALVAAYPPQEVLDALSRFG